MIESGGCACGRGGRGKGVAAGKLFCTTQGEMHGGIIAPFTGTRGRGDGPSLVIRGLPIVKGGTGDEPAGGDGPPQAKIGRLPEAVGCVLHCRPVPAASEGPCAGRHCSDSCSLKGFDGRRQEGGPGCRPSRWVCASDGAKGLWFQEWTTPEGEARATSWGGGAPDHYTKTRDGGETRLCAMCCVAGVHRRPAGGLARLGTCLHDAAML
jgi:hypothetical protein